MRYGTAPAAGAGAGARALVAAGPWRVWPVSADCDAAVNDVKDSVRRRTRFYTFELTAAADVTIRLSSDDRDTHMALWRGSTDPIVNGLLHVDLSSTPVATNNDVATGYGYLDGNDTDSRIQATLAKGVYVVSAATLTTPDSQDRHTINVKAIPTKAKDSTP